MVAVRTYADLMMRKACRSTAPVRERTAQIKKCKAVRDAVDLLFIITDLRLASGNKAHKLALVLRATAALKQLYDLYYLPADTAYDPCLNARPLSDEKTASLTLGMADACAVVGGYAGGERLLEEGRLGWYLGNWLSNTLARLMQMSTTRIELCKTAEQARQSLLSLKLNQLTGAAALQFAAWIAESGGVIFDLCQEIERRNAQGGSLREQLARALAEEACLLAERARLRKTRLIKSIDMPDGRVIGLTHQCRDEMVAAGRDLREYSHDHVIVMPENWDAVCGICQDGALDRAAYVQAKALYHHCAVGDPGLRNREDLYGWAEQRYDADGHRTEDRNFFLPACGHAFCKGCLAGWANLNPTCPACRLAIFA